MAGIGVKLNKIYDKNTLTTDIIGFGYSTAISIAPMFLVIGAILLMQLFLGFNKVSYGERELFACTILYIFVFGLLTASPFNAVLSKYMSDVIYEEKYEDIMPCYYLGLIMNIGLSIIVGVPFTIHEFVAGEVSSIYVLIGFCGYQVLVIVFYTMLYLSICKDYAKISKFFAIGMTFTVLFSLLLTYVFDVDASYSMLISIVLGFMFIAALEYALVRSYFRENSGNYKPVFMYMRRFWKLIATNVLYTLGLYIHNFVFWASDMHMVVRNSFVCMNPYDMATCIAMFTNISSSVIFISKVEMHFHERYKRYSEAVIGGRGMDINNAKKRMFEQLREEVTNLVRIQFIVSVVVFLVCIIFLPRFGFGGLVMQIYPLLACGYFILFAMYGVIIFLYYFSDLTGALVTALVFCATTVVATYFTSKLSPIWYGLGFVIGSFAGWTVAYFRLRYIEKNLDVHIFCTGNVLRKGEGERPGNKVFDRSQNYDSNMMH